MLFFFPRGCPKCELVTICKDDRTAWKPFTCFWTVLCIVYLFFLFLSFFDLGIGLFRALNNCRLFLKKDVFFFSIVMHFGFYSTQWRNRSSQACCWEKEKVSKYNLVLLEKCHHWCCFQPHFFRAVPPGLFLVMPVLLNNKWVFPQCVISFSRKAINGCNCSSYSWSIPKAQSVLPAEAKSWRLHHPVIHAFHFARGDVLGIILDQPVRSPCTCNLRLVLI